MSFEPPAHSSVAEISDQLAREEEWLRNLEGNVEKSHNLKEQMMNILDSFQKRLDVLDKTVTPLYNKTHLLQTQQQNINKSMKSIDTTLEYHAIAIDMESIIRERDPGSDLKKYLKMLEKLEKAMDFFSGSKEYEHQLENVKASYDHGCSSLKREFKDSLKRASIPLKASVVLAAVGEDYAEIENQITPLNMMADSTVESLQTILTFLCADPKRILKTRHNVQVSELLSNYAEVRAATVIRSLQAIQDSRKSNSRGASPTIDRKTATLLQGKTLKKVSSKAMLDQGYRRGATTLGVPSEMPEASLDRDCETFLLMFGASRALLTTEMDLMRKVLPSEKSKSSLPSNVEPEKLILQTLITKPIHHVLEFAEMIGIEARKSIGKRDPASFICLYTLSQYLHSNISALAKLTKTGGQDLFSKLMEVRKSIDAVNVKTLEDFIEMVKGDQEKFVPKDCTVHQVTSNTLVFLEQLMEYRDCLSVVLNQDSENEASKFAVAKMFARILSSLGLNLQNKAASYTDPYHKALFMLNNYNHIQKGLTKSGILKIVSQQNREVENYYQTQVKQYRQQYLQCWGRVAGSLSEFGQNRAMPSPIPDKEREQLKGAFALFNRELDGINQNQRDLSVPDPELASQIRKESREMVMSKYHAFYQTYAGSGFTKNPDKYIRYTPETVSIVIDHLFASQS